jgi:TP901 family phage tail tape measure protein
MASGKAFDFDIKWDGNQSLTKMIENMEKALAAQGKLIKGADKMREALDRIKKSHVEITKETKKQEQAIKNASTGKEVEQAIGKTQQQAAATGKLRKEIIALEKEKNRLLKANKAANEQDIRRRAAINAENKAIREQIKDEKALEMVKKRTIKSQKDLREVTNSLVRLRDKLDTTTKKGRKAWEEYTRRIKNNTDKLKENDAQIGRHQRNVGNYASVWNKVGASLKRVAGQIALTVTSLLGIQAAIRGIRESVDAFQSFDEGFSNVLTLLSGADRQKFGVELESGAIELIEKYGFAIEDVNKALFDAVSAGIPAGDAIEFMNNSAKLAIGGATDLGTAVDGTTSILNAYAMEADQASVVQAAFFSAQKEGKTTVEELSNSIGQVAPIAKSVGISFQEVLAAQAALTKGGLSTENATTALKGLFVALEKPSQSAVKAIEQLNKELGTNIPKSASELKKVGLGNALRDINIAAQENEDAIAQILPNVRALTAANALQAEGLDEYDSILKTVNEDIGESSSLNEAFALKMQTASQRSKSLNGEIKAMQIQLGKNLLPILNDIKQGFIDFARWIGRNSTEIKKAAKALLIIVAAYKAAAFAGRLYRKELVAGSIAQKALALSGQALAVVKALLTGNIKKATAAMRLLNKTFKLSPIGLVTAGIVGLGMAFLDMETAAEKAAKTQKAFNAQLQESARIGALIAKQRGEKVEERATDREEEIQKKLQKLRDEGADEDKIRDEEAFLRRREVIALQREATKEAKVQSEAQKKIEEERLKIGEFREQLAQNELLLNNRARMHNDEVQKLEMQRGFIQLNIQDSKRKMSVQNEIIKGQEEVISGIVGNIADEEESILSLKTQQTTAIDEQTDAEKKAAEEKRKARQKELDSLRRRLEDLQDLDIKDEERREIARLKRKTDREIASIKGMTEVEVALRKQLDKDYQEDVIEIHKKFAEKKAKAEYDAKVTGIKNQLNLDKLINEATIEDEDELRAENLKFEAKALEDQIALVKGNNAEQVELRRQLIAKLNALNGQILTNGQTKAQKALDAEMKANDMAFKEKHLALLNEELTQEEFNKRELENKKAQLEEELAILVDHDNNIIDLDEQVLDKKIEIAELEVDLEAQKQEDIQNLISETKKIVDQGIQDGFNKAKAASEERLQLLRDQEAAQKSNVDLQRDLAKRGAENTLAFEQQIQREKEKAILQEQKRLERIKKIETYYNLFSAYASDPNTNPATAAGKALIQLAIGEGIAAKLEDGGVISDAVAAQNGGVIKGASHRNGGVLIEAEGSEGIFSKKEMANIGRDRFYALKNVFADRRMTDDYFQAGNSKLVAVQNNGGQSVAMANKLNEVTQAIKDLPNKMPKTNQWIDKHGNLVTKTDMNNAIKTNTQKRRFSK